MWEGGYCEENHRNLNNTRSKSKFALCIAAEKWHYSIGRLASRYSILVVSCSLNWMILIVEHSNGLIMFFIHVWPRKWISLTAVFLLLFRAARRKTNGDLSGRSSHLYRTREKDRSRSRLLSTFSDLHECCKMATVRTTRGKTSRCNRVTSARRRRGNEKRLGEWEEKRKESKQKEPYFHQWRWLKVEEEFSLSFPLSRSLSLSWLLLLAEANSDR